MEILSKKRLEACILLEAQESLYAMSNVHTDYFDYGASFQINPSEDRLGEPYFKVYDSFSIDKARRVARLSFNEPKYIIHKDGLGKQPWFMNASEKKYILSILKKNKHSVWKKLIANWNKEKYQVKSRHWNLFTESVKTLITRSHKEDFIAFEQSSDLLQQKAYKFMLSVFNIDNISQFKAINEDMLEDVLSRVKQCMPIDKPMPDYMQLVE